MTKKELQNHKGPVWGISSRYEYPIMLDGWTFMEDPNSMGIKSVRGEFSPLSVFPDEQSAILEMLTRTNRLLTGLHAQSGALVMRLIMLNYKTE